MANIVRRVPPNDGDENGEVPRCYELIPVNNPSEGRDSVALPLERLREAGLTPEVRPHRCHRSRGARLTVHSQLTVGIEQRLYLKWTVDPSYIGRDMRVVGFRNTKGFGGPRSRGDLSGYGTQIVEGSIFGDKEEHLGEGEYFYTFALIGSKLLGLAEGIHAIVQFSETIPGAELMIQRLEQTLRGREILQRLLQQSAEINAAARDVDVGNAGDRAGPRPAPKQSAMRPIDRLLRKEKREIRDLKSGAAWKLLTKDQQRRALGDIRERYERLAQELDG